MPEPIPFTPRPSEYTCSCGSVWFTTAVQFDTKAERVVSHSLTHAVCRECGLPVKQGGAEQ